MAVRLKIRGKLVLSFSAVMVLVLSGLGYITYLTFADSIHSHKDQIANLQLDNIRLRIDRSLSTRRQHLRQLSGAVATQGWQRFDYDAVIRTHALEGIAVVGQGGQVVRRAGRVDAIEHWIAQRAPRYWFESPAAIPPRLIDDSLLLVSEPATAGGDTLRLLLQLPKQQLIEFSGLSTQPDQGVVLLSRQHQLLLDSAADREGEHQSLLAQLDGSELGGGLTRVGEVYAIRDRLPALDLDLWYVIEERHYLQSIIELKNRVVAATIVILWCSIWIVLIVAYKIARPIRALSQATDEMQQSEYSQPLQFKDTGDEVGDLGTRFESMRLHIDGLISRDPLSNLFNRRYLMRSLALEVSKAVRGNQPLCCLMMDLDRFKQTNDTYGHQCGDAVIKHVADIIQGSLRNYDISARYGGEEFIVVLPMTDLEHAIAVAERIRHSIAQSPVVWEAEVLRVTVSIGVAKFTVSNDLNGERMISMADEALYRAKQDGRNRVAIASSVVVGDPPREASGG